MSLSTFADLKTTAATFLNRSNLTSLIPYFVQLVETKIAYGELGPGGQWATEPLRIRAMETSSDLAISSQTVALPTGWLQARRLYLNTDPVQELNFVSPDMFWKTYLSSYSASPKAYTIEGENFVLGPIPDGSYTGKLLYYKKFTALSSDTDTNWLLQNAFGVYLNGTLAEAFKYARQNDEALARQAMFAGAIAGLNASDKKDRYAGTVWQARTDTGAP